MRRFKDLLKNKFVWGKHDVEHEKPVKETKLQRALKFTWGHDDLEHHTKDVKESLDEKFELSPDHKGNYNKPNHLGVNTAYTFAHPFKKASNKTGIGVPDHGDESHEAFVAHHDSLDDDELHSLDHYKSDGYADINKHLRNAHKEFKKARNKHLSQQKKDNAGLKFKDEPEHHKHLKAGNKFQPHHDEHDEEPSDDEYHEHQIDDHIHHLDNVTNHRTVEHHVVFRGGHPGDKHKFPIGHEFTDHGYVSTSFDHEKGRSFANEHYDSKEKKHKRHMHVIHVPKGSRGHFFDVHGQNAGHSNAHEKEFVLNRGTRFKVTHHSEDGDTHYIHTRVIKQGIRHKFNFKSKQKNLEPKPKDDHGLPGQHKFPFMKHHKRFK